MPPDVAALHPDEYAAFVRYMNKENRATEKAIKDAERQARRR
jgi:hypothetical protein